MSRFIDTKLFSVATFSTSSLPDTLPLVAEKTLPRRANFPYGNALPSPEEYHSIYSGQPAFTFEAIHSSKKSNARVGRITTPHGVIDTPGFVPVATNAALKALDINHCDEYAGVQLMFANTYHLMLHPGSDIIEQAGGLHSFMGRDATRPLITDSGGFQVFSLAYGTVHEELHSLKRSAQGNERRSGNLVLRIDEDGVTFKSYRDGTKMQLTPESSIKAQKALGADIILPLDELPPYHCNDQMLRASWLRSHLWEARSLQAHARDPRSQAMYAIIHGGSDRELRQQSAEWAAAMPFDGFAVGGALGKDREELRTIIGYVMPKLDAARPCHVLGIADPVSIPKLIPLGCDTFDSCFATRVGRHGGMLKEDGGTVRVNAGENKTKFDRPAVEGCACPTCRRHSLAYLHHLVKAHEPVAASLLTMHNVYTMCKMMERIRGQILNDEL